MKTIDYIRSMLTSLALVAATGTVAADKPNIVIILETFCLILNLIKKVHRK